MKLNWRLLCHFKDINIYLILRILALNTCNIPFSIAISKKFKLKRSSSLAGHDICPSLPHEFAISKKQLYLYILAIFVT